MYVKYIHYKLRRDISYTVEPHHNEVGYNKILSRGNPHGPNDLATKTFHCIFSTQYTTPILTAYRYIAIHIMLKVFHVIFEADSHSMITLEGKFHYIHIHSYIHSYIFIYIHIYFMN